MTFAYDTAVLTDSPVSYWPLGDNIGNIVPDTLGANSGVGSPGLTSGIGGAGTATGTSFTFNGTTGYVDCGVASSLNLSRNFTLEAFVKTTISGAGSSLSIISHGPNGWYLRVHSGKLEFLKSQASSLVAGVASVADGAWHHVAVTVDGSGNIVVYVDGAQDATGSTGLTFSSGTHVTIGRETSSGGAAQDFMDGSLDEVAVYNVALSSVTIAAHYAARNSGYQSTVAGTSGLLSYWKLDGSFSVVATDLADSNPGTYTIGTTQGQMPPGRFQSGSVALDGSTGRVSVPDAVNIRLAAPLSVEAWIRTTTTTSIPILAKYPTTPNAGYGLYLLSGILSMWVGDTGASWFSAGSSVADNLWHHVVGTLSGTTVKLYIDGVLVGTGTRSPSLVNTVALYIGTSPDSPGALNFPGNIAAAAVYSTALSAAQVLAHYQAAGPSPYAMPDTYTTRPFRPTLQKSWSNNMLMGYIPTGRGPTVPDLTNAHPGTVNGNVTWSHGIYGEQANFADNGGTGSYINLGTVPQLSGLFALTISVFVTLDSYADAPKTDGFRFAWSAERISATYPQCSIFYNSSSRTIQFNGRYNDFPNLTFPVFALGKPTLITGRFTPFGVQSLWQGPYKQSEQSLGGWQYATDIVPTCYLGDGYTIESSNWSGAILAAYVWSRTLSDAEIVALAADPFAPVRSRHTSPILFAPTGSIMDASASLSFEAGSVGSGGLVGGGQSNLSSLSLLAGEGGLVLGGNSSLFTLNQLSAPNSVSTLASASLSVAGPLSSVGGASLDGSVGITSLSPLVGAGGIGAVGTTVLSSQNEISAFNSSSVLVSASFSSLGQLAGEGALTLGGATALSSENSLVTSPSLLAGAQTSLSYLNVLFAYDSTTILASASMSSSAPLVGGGTLSLGGATAFSSLVTLPGAAVLGINGAASLTSDVFLSSIASTSILGAATLSGESLVFTVDVAPSPADISGPRDDRFYFINESYQVPFSHRFLDHGYTSP